MLSNKFALKTSVAVVLGALSAVANAQVDLDASAPVSVKYASEANISTSGTTLIDGANVQRAAVTLGASLGTNVTGYVRVDLAGGNFACNPTFAINASAGAADTVLSSGGNGTNFAIFAVTPSAGASLIGTNSGTIDTAAAATCGVRVTDKSGVTMTYRLFETLTNAANPTSTNTLKTRSGVSYVAFTPGLAVASTAASATADVGATNGAYTNFTPTGVKSLSNIAITESGALLPATGLAATDGDIAASGVVTVTGDFQGVRNTNDTYTGAALDRVYLSAGVDCSTTSAAATALSATSATFASFAGTALAAPSRQLCFTPQGTQQIQASTYTGLLDLTAQTGFTVTDPALNIGSISRNGITAVAPLVQIPTGFLSRLVLVNRGSASRDYTVTAISESGVTLTLSGAAAGGTLAANQTRVIDLPTLISGGIRGSLVVTVNAPLSQVDLLYQVVSPNNAVSNMLLSYK
ncbi:MAG: hypothetical protein ING52_08145 [Burkholderiales bacterium]|nr:hypothetical protein [Burkholderiales bacterium]